MKRSNCPVNIITDGVTQEALAVQAILPAE
jgi:hypothetical protein